MKVIYGLGKTHKKRAVVTIGVFDGLHRGHRRILRKLVDRAKRKKIRSCVITFEDHPFACLHPGKKISLLSAPKEKMDLLRAEGVDCCHLLRFDKDFSSIDPERFVRDILIGHLAMDSLIVGEDFVFGRGARGDIRLLKRLSQKFGFNLFVVDHLKAGARVVSSTQIRALLSEGRLEEAEKLLGRPFSLSGSVQRGEGRGSGLGFPTANILTDKNILLPDGVYAARAKIGTLTRRALAYIGTKPTFGPGKRGCEVFLLDFKKHIYGRRLCVQFLARIRKDIKFISPLSLRQQMMKDLQIIRC